jgi:hypothetical protein
VAALCRGQTLQAYAEATGAGLTTAKTHLRAVFAKTGERRQTDLMLRVKGDAALAVADPDRPGEA